MFDQLQAELVAFVEILLINVALSGDNAVVVGMAAAGVHRDMRRRVIFWGMAGAVVLRIFFAAIATKLLAVVGLTLAGGILLLWVSWKMYREITESREAESLALAAAEGSFAGGEMAAHDRPEKTFGQAMTQIVLADISMSLDNVLAVAGVARSHLWVMVVGLLISIALMGVAASLLASLLARYRWIAWAGLAVIFYVAVDMVFSGWHEVACAAELDAMCSRGLLGGLWALISGR